MPGRHVVLADRGVERRDVLVAQLVGQRGHRVGGDEALQRQAGAARLAGDRLLAGLDRLLAPLLGEPLLDLLLGPRRGDELQPVARGPGALGLRGEDLDDLAVLELALERDEPAVDAAADALVADLGVHGVGEVDRRRPAGQRDHVALRCEHEDLAGGEVVAQRLEELAGVRGLALPVEQLAHPRHLVELERAVTGGAARVLGPALGDLLVPPVRGNAVLRGPVHLVGADLHLERLAVRPDHGGVQRLVHPEPGLRDVVLEPARHRLPQGVHHAHRGVAVADVLHEHPHAHQVVDVVEVLTLDDHLLVDRVVVLRAAEHLGLDPGLGQLTGHLVDHGAQVGVAAGRAVGDEADDLVVALGVQDREREVLELPLHRRHPEAVGQRREHLECLAGLLGLLLRLEEAHRAHVVQPVGQLDDQHARVARHRDDHLADRLGLGGRAELDLVELRDAVDEVRDLGPEVGRELVQRVGGVLDGVVQQRGDQRRRVHPQLAEDRRHGQRVGDVRVAALAHLPVVGALGGVVGALQRAHVRRRVQLPVDGGQRFEHRLDAAGALRGDAPRDPRPDPARRRRRAGGADRRRGREAGGVEDRVLVRGVRSRAPVRGDRRARGVDVLAHASSPSLRAGLRCPESIQRIPAVAVCPDGRTPIGSSVALDRCAWR